ncbi:MAG: AraC family transcriptional regulator ligand-binding domain-containing protein [Chloroflexota bacterium]
MTTRYIVDAGWRILAADAKIPTQDVLRQAELPLDLLSRKNPTLTGDEFMRFFQALGEVMKDDPEFVLRLGSAIQADTFSPPLFACFCSDNLNVAANRIAHYKPLVGPLRLDVTQNSERTTVGFKGLPQNMPPPPTLIAFELVFWVRIVRLATRTNVVPLTVHTTIDIPAASAYEDYFGTHIRRDSFNGISFSAQDAARPFLTASDEMWSIYEPRLNQRMQDLQQEATFTDKVRACLMEVLASGEYGIADVARKLAVSPRTLQRRLRAEDTSFQKELDTLREELARSYLTTSDYTSGQIAFLLGYEDPNSFFRAFRSWTGQTPEVVREGIQ